MQKLTVKQQKFVDAFIKTGNATQAALDAGYSKKTAPVIGYENLKKPYVASAIKEQMDALHKSKIPTLEEVLEFFGRVIRGEEMTKVVCLDDRGHEITTLKPPSEKAKLEAAKELSRRYPASPELIEAQIAKAKADAKNAEAQAKVAEDKAASITRVADNVLDKLSQLSTDDLEKLARMGDDDDDDE